MVPSFRRNPQMPLTELGLNEGVTAPVATSTASVNFADPVSQ